MADRDFDQANQPFLANEGGGDDDEPVDNSKTTYALILACVSAIAAFLFGWTLGFSAPALQPMENPNNDGSIASPFKCTDWNGINKKDGTKPSNYGLCKTSDEGDLFGSLVNIGCMIGALLGGAISDKLGRRTALMIASVPFAGGWAWMGATASGTGALLTARVLTGIAVGIVSGQVPTYIAETAPPRLRGALGCINQLAITIGIFFVYAMGLLTQKEVELTASFPDGVPPVPAVTAKFADWSLIAYVGAIISAAFTVICLTFLPETPKWLVMQGRTEQATKVLRKLRGEEYDVQGEIDAQQKAAAGDAAGAAGLADLADCKPQLFIGCTMMVLQQFTGINAVIFYSTEIFSDAGVNGATGSLIVMGVQVVITAIACLLVDKLGRVKLMTMAASGMIVASLAMSLFYKLKDGGNQINSLAILAMVAYIVFFSLGMGAIPWLLMSEIFPARVRGIAGSVATCVNWTCSFIITETFSKLNAALGQSGTFLFFAIELCITVAFIQKCVPETKGKSLEEIEAFFNKQK